MRIRISSILEKIRRKPLLKVEEAPKLPEEELAVVDFYPVNPPYSYIGIYSRKDGGLMYKVIEPHLNRYEREVLELIKSYTLEEIEVEPRMILDPSRAASIVASEVRRIASKYKLLTDSELSLEKITYYVVRDFVGYGILDPIVRDVNVEDITCDGVGPPIYVYHRFYEWLPTNVRFENQDQLLTFARRLAVRAGQSLTTARPIVEGPLPEGYRVHLTLQEVSRRGPTFTIRKYSETPFTPVDLIALGTIDSRLAAYYWMLVENVGSTIIIGRMASGKTSLLNAITMFIKPESKIVTVEETPELRLPHENWTPLVTRPSFEREVQEVTLFDLLKSALRQRPEYIIVGEIRGEEAYTFFQAMAVGHGGLTTFHAESVESAIARLESPPINIPRPLIPLVKSFTLINRVKLEKGGEKIVRRVISVSEVVGLEPSTKELIFHEVFRWNPVEDKLEYVGKSYVLEQIAENTMRSLREVVEEYERRAAIMEVLNKEGIRKFEEVSRIIREYYANPEETYSKLVGR